MRLGFHRGRAASGFYPTENGARSSDLIRRRGVTGPFNGPGGRARCGVLSAQAHVAAWVAARASAELGRAVLPVGPQRSKELSHFSFSNFPVKCNFLENDKWLKENWKREFSCG